MKHRWVLLGGAGGWEIWGCNDCGEERVPVPFFKLWRPWKRRCGRSAVA